MQSFDVAVGPGAPGTDLALRDAVGQAAGELTAPELVGDAVRERGAIPTSSPGRLVSMCGAAGASRGG